MDLPFLWFTLLPRPSNVFRRVVAGAFILAGMLVVGRTSSRGGLVAISLLVVFLGWSLSFLNKVKLILGLAVVIAVVMGLLSPDQRARYTTMFGSSAGESEEVERSALESREARLELLKESLRFTAYNPIFGVGPGVYEAYAADVAVSEGRRG